MNWYIGQEIVCVWVGKGDSGLVKDKIYTILALRGSTCLCPDVEMHVGLYSNFIGPYNTYCEDCGHIHDDGMDATYWLSETHFAPLMDISELKEILNEEIQRV